MGPPQSEIKSEVDVKQQVELAMHEKDLDYIKKEMAEISTSIQEIGLNTAEITKTYSKELLHISTSIAKMHEMMVTLKCTDEKISQQLTKITEDISAHNKRINCLRNEAIRSRDRTVTLSKVINSLKTELATVKKTIENENNIKQQFFGKISFAKSIATFIIGVVLIFAKDIYKWIVSLF